MSSQNALQTDTIDETLNSLSLSVLRHGNAGLPERAQVLAHGGGHVVLQLPELPDNHVLKVAKPPAETGNPLVRGIVQNAVEIDLTRLHHSLSEIILPLETWPQNHTRWVIAPKTQPISESSEQFATDLSRLIRLGLNTSEYHTEDNWGHWKGDNYLIDYGYFEPDTHQEISSLLEKNQVWRRNVAVWRKWQSEANR